jgi:hypothetical protein
MATEQTGRPRESGDPVAPAPERDAGALVRDSLIELWWSEQLANHPALRATDLYNPLRQAVTELKARLG